MDVLRERRMDYTRADDLNFFGERRKARNERGFSVHREGIRDREFITDIYAG